MEKVAGDPEAFSMATGSEARVTLVATVPRAY